MAYLSPWHRRVGVELTFCPDVGDAVKNVKEATRVKDLVYKYCELARYTVKEKLRKQNIKVWHVGNDDGCLEIPTPPMRSWRAFTEKYERIKRPLINMGFYPQVDYFGTGGGHVNIECHDENLRQAVVMDCATRPYLNWCFNDPEDDDTGRSVVGILHYKHYGFFDSRHAGFACSRDGNRLEFRGFIAAKNWHEQEEHVAFVQKYVEWVNRRLKRGIVTEIPKGFDKTFNKATYKESKESFLKFIDELKLPVYRYESYTNTYLKERYRIGNLI